MPSGSRLRLVLTCAALLLAAPSCGLLPSSHYKLTTLPFSPEQGWVPLPTARWLVNPGIEPDALMFCPRDNCAEQAFVARMELTGRETGFADLLINDPVRALTSASPTHQSRHKQSVARADVTPLALAGWTGGSVRLMSRKNRTKAAHVAVVARREGQNAWVMFAVAATSLAAIQQLRQALD